MRNTVEPFESVWLQALGTRSTRLLELIPLRYVQGMSQRDVEVALIEALSVKDRGRSVISQVLCRGLRGEVERWQNRDLSEYRLMTLFLDGIALRRRPEDTRTIAVLCASGMLGDGRKVLLHLAIGDKACTRCSRR